MTAEEMQ